MHLAAKGKIWRTVVLVATVLALEVALPAAASSPPLETAPSLDVLAAQAVAESPAPAGAGERFRLYAPGKDPLADIASTRFHLFPEAKTRVRGTNLNLAPRVELHPLQLPHRTRLTLFGGGKLRREARNRHFDAALLGRFLQMDPLGYIDGPNVYQYGLNSPVNFSDPLGLAVRVGPDQFKHKNEAEEARSELRFLLQWDVIKSNFTDRNYQNEVLSAVGRALWHPIVEVTSAPGTELMVANPMGMAGFIDDAARAAGAADEVVELAGSGKAAVFDARVQRYRDPATGQFVPKGIIARGDAALDFVPSRYRASVARSFRGEPVAESLADDLVVYRRSGGRAPETGSPWFSPQPYVRPGNARRYLALPETNTAENLTAFRIPSGTTILRGRVASQAREIGFGPNAIGGGVQIYIPDPSVAVPIR